MADQPKRRGRPPMPTMSVARTSQKIVEMGERPSGFITLRVHPSYPLPFTMTRKEGTFIFQPDAHVPEAIAKALLQTHSHLLSVAEGKPDLRAYKFQERFEEGLLLDTIKKLDRENQAKVYRFVRELQSTEMLSETAEGEDEQTTAE